MYIYYSLSTVTRDEFAIGGLEDPAYGKEYTFSTQRGRFVQILHANGNHWITVSNINCRSGITNLLCICNYCIGWSVFLYLHKTITIEFMHYKALETDILLLVCALILYGGVNYKFRFPCLNVIYLQVYKSLTV